MKKIARAMISIGVLLAFTGCAWKVPETISLKSDADYSFSLGTFEKELDSKMDIQSMMGNAGSGNQDINFFDYYPGKSDANTQHFLLQAKACEIDFADVIPNLQTFIDNLKLLPDDATLDLSKLPSYTIPLESQGIDFNPSSMLSGIKDAIGSDLADKISFEKVPLYLYCEFTEGLKAKVTLRMFYGTSTDPIVERYGTSIDVLDGTNYLESRPLPVFEKEEDIVITNLETSTDTYLTTLDIQELINNDSPLIDDGDQLCIEYGISDISGILTKAAVEAGIKLTIYAVIDLPLKFKATDDIEIDLSDLTGNSSGSGISTGSSSNSKLSEILDIVDAVSVKYVAYKLPIYSNSGMELCVDLFGDGKYKNVPLVVTNKPKNQITEADKQIISFDALTVEKLRENQKIDPKFLIKMENNANFSIPREKAVEMNLEVHIKTDGTIKVRG